MLSVCLQRWLFIAGKALHTQREIEDPRVCELFVCAIGCCRGIETEGEVRKASQDSGKRLGATWSARFFPMFPSLYSIMNGFLLVCGRGLSLNSILTKSQNTHSSQSVSQSVSLPACQPASILASECSRPPFHLLQTHSVTHRYIGYNDRNGFGGTYFGEFHVT